VKVTVPEQMFDELDRLYAPRDDPVFNLTPPWFHAIAQQAYDGLMAQGLAYAVDHISLWTVFQNLLYAVDNRLSDYEHMLVYQLILDDPDEGE
jgi:hypothetical protein